MFEPTHKNSRGFNHNESQHNFEAKIHKEKAFQFLSRLDSEAIFFTFQTFDDNSKRKDRQLARILHGTLDEHYQELCHLQSKKPIRQR